MKVNIKEKSNISYGTHLNFKKTAFTLVELLVVISIIALLLSILMPGLSKAREQTYRVVCKSNLRQWGLAASMYTNDADGAFPEGVKGMYNTPPTEARGLWFVAFKRYLNNKDVRCCPTAKEPGSVSSNFNQYIAWGIFDEGHWQWFADAEEAVGEYGSYGFNDWLYNEPHEWKYNGGEVSKDWRNINMAKDPANIPVLLDSVWVGGKPKEYMMPPDIPNVWSGGGQHLKRFCIDRHGGFTNCLYLDLSVRSVSLKQLWKMRWHKEWPMDYPLPPWPEWMANFRNPE